MIGADHSKASNQPIVRVNNTSTTNFCPGKFAERMRDMLNLTASLPAKAQRSVEAREFLAIVNRVARFYADRVEKDYRIFQHFAVHVLNLKNCNIEAIWEEGQRHEAGKDDKHEEEEDNLEFASIPDRTYSATLGTSAATAAAGSSRGRTPSPSTLSRPRPRRRAWTMRSAWTCPRPRRPSAPSRWVCTGTPAS